MYIASGEMCCECITWKNLQEGETVCRPEYWLNTFLTHSSTERLRSWKGLGCYSWQRLHKVQSPLLDHFARASVHLVGQHHTHSQWRRKSHVHHAAPIHHLFTQLLDVLLLIDQIKIYVVENFLCLSTIKTNCQDIIHPKLLTGFSLSSYNWGIWAGLPPN